MGRRLTQCDAGMLSTGLSCQLIGKQLWCGKLGEIKPSRAWCHTECRVRSTMLAPSQARILRSQLSSSVVTLKSVISVRAALATQTLQLLSSLAGRLQWRCLCQCDSKRCFLSSCSVRGTSRSARMCQASKGPSVLCVRLGLDAAAGFSWGSPPQALLAGQGSGVATDVSIQEQDVV